MDDEGQSYANRSFRIARSSNNAISSTTATPSQRLSSSVMNRSSAANGGDEDELTPSSSTPSFATPRQRTRNSAHHLFNSSSLGSPDSTYPSMSTSYHSRGNGAASTVVQDPCVVSSSTVDDIPQSPFAEEANGPYHMLPQPPSTPPSPLQLPPVNSSPPPLESSGSGSGGQGHYGANGGHQRSPPPQLPANIPSASSSSSYSLSSSSVAFSASSFSNISPLRNKIKKASSFERFSAQAQASSSNNQNAASSLQEPNSSITGMSTAAVSSIQALRTSGGWDYEGTGSVSKNFVSSRHDGASGISGTKPYLIKKLVARLANEAELERLEAAAASALAAEAERSTSHNSSIGCDTVDGVGQHSSIPPPQSTICNTPTEMAAVDSLIRRQLSQSTLNTVSSDCSTSTVNFCDSDPTVDTVSSRLAAGSSKPFTKKIPLTPKQKLLHRMQSGELTIPLATTPPPPSQQHRESTVAVPHPSQIPEQQMLMTSFPPQQQHMMMHDLSKQFCMDDPQGGGGGGVLDDESASPGTDRYGTVMNYEAFIRSTAGDDFSESMVKGDEGGNSQILYDASDPYNYYYGNILNEDEIFISNGGGNGANGLGGGGCSHASGSSRIVHGGGLGHGGGLEDGIQFSQGPGAHGGGGGHLEFILGLPEAGERGRGDEAMQLVEQGGAEELQIQQQQFLDSGELGFAAGKAGQVGEISTLRNLLMMEPLAAVSRSQQHVDESWISAAAAEYQNRMTSATVRMTGNMTSMVPGSGSGGAGSWVSEWPSRVWQGQGQSHDHVSHDHDGEQEEVMDMSVMETKRGLSTHHLHNTHSSASQQQHGLVMEEVDLVTERDLTNGLPLLTTMPMDLQSFSGGQGSNLTLKGQILSDPSALIMTPQQHPQRSVILEYDDEPVNLMSAVNLEQALVHHQGQSRESENLSTLSLSHGGQVHGDQSYGNVCGANIIFTTTSTTSTTVATAFDSTQGQGHADSPQGPLTDQPGQETNMDEKRIIRVKKKALDDSPEALDNKRPNFILDKPVQPKSFASLPSLLTLTRMSGNGWGVLTNRNKKIPKDARFGPVEGPLKRVTVADLEDTDTVYPVLAMVDSGGVVYQLDRMDDDLCNWMKFVRRARSGQEQNVLVSEEEGLLYFTSCREIPSKTELRVGYGLEYAEKYSLPHFAVEAISLAKEATGSASRKGSRKPKRKAEEAEEEKFVCFECDLNCGSLEELNRHLDSGHVDGDSDEFRRPKKKAIRKFYKSLNDGSAEGEGKVKGTAEAEASTTKRSLKKKEIERLRKEQEEVPIVESSSPDILPEVEEKVLEAERDAAASSSAALPAIKVKCNLCYKAFATQHRLQKHMMVHGEEHLKPLKCEVCSKRFLTNSALAGHSKCHEGKYFECPLCEFCTEQLLLLKEHVQSHKNQDTGTFSCPHCPKHFSCYSLVRKHIRAFHGPRLFSCDDCAMKFPTPDKLKLHELRHSTFRAYLCAECGRQFKRKDKLTDHTRKAHGKLKCTVTRILREEEGEGSGDFLIDEKPTVDFGKTVYDKKPSFGKKVLPRLTEEQLTNFTFRCQDCMIGFRRRGMLVNHLAKRHPEIDPEHVPELALPITRTAKNYFCPHCERIYKSSSKRKSHILKNHPGKAVPPQVRAKDLKAILEEKVGSTTLDFNLNDFECAELENIKVTVDEAIRKEAVVGEIIGTPHACTWCHRQYATRAKLLQHQRKFHIELMPPEIQTPRPQKNNVKHMEQAEVVEGSHLIVEEMEPVEDLESSEHEPSPSTLAASEKPIPHQSQENMFGYLITTNGHVTNNEIETILQPEFMMSLLAQQSAPASSSASATSSSQSGARTITLCIPPGMIPSTSTNPTSSHVISSAVSVSGAQILTKTD